MSESRFIGEITIKQASSREWVWRCWGDIKCNGWLGQGHKTFASAAREAQNHLSEHEETPDE